jgi:hypothetical protein
MGDAQAAVSPSQCYSAQEDKLTWRDTKRTVAQARRCMAVRPWNNARRTDRRLS